MASDPSSGTALRTSRTLASAGAGLAATTVVIVLYLLGGLGRLELIALDERFRISPAAPDEGIVLVEIDDASLEHIGRWPWNRAVLAELLNVLQEANPRRIALDIIFPEPQPIRYESADLDVLQASSAEIIGQGPPRPVFDDLRLARALGDARVVLPVHLEPLDQVSDTDLALVPALDEFLEQNPDASLPRATQAMGDLGFAPPTVRSQYLRQRARQALAPLTVGSARAPSQASAETSAACPAAEGLVVPPLFAFAREADGAGFVQYRPEFDGVVRRLSMIGRSGDLVLPQLALGLLSSHRQASAPITCRRGPGHLLMELPGVETPLRLDPMGQLLIDWRSTDAFRSISARSVYQVVSSRDQANRIRDVMRLTGLTLARRMSNAPILDAFQRVDRLHARWVRQTADAWRDRLWRPGQAPDRMPPDQPIRQAEAELDKLIRRLPGEMGFFLQGADPNDPNVAELRELAERIPRLHSEAALLDRAGDRQLDSLRDHLHDRYVLVGSTATGAADFVPTPAAPRMPGVFVHANILATLRQAVRPRSVAWWVHLLVVAAMGTVTAAVSSRLPVWWAIPASLALAIGYMLFNALVLFAQFRLSVALVGPVVAAAVSLLVVVSFRQLTEQRAKQRIRGLFAQSLSSELVDRIIDDPDVMRLGGERRTVSCLFADIEGFTALSERLGERQIVDILNRYFNRVVAIIQDDGGGYLNKFLGDGVFALFGAPVPQDDHPRRALRAGLACQSAARDLSGELGDVLPDGRPLGVRIGITTGPAVVGNCGAAGKSDYTAIGDTVNLASRLESANKALGTRVLVNEAAWQQGGAGLLGRPVGRLRVYGKQQPVGVWEVLGVEADASANLRQAVEAYRSGWERVGQGRLVEAVEAFQRCESLHPRDTVAVMHQTACEALLDTGQSPGDDWDLLELTSKG